MVIAFAVGLRRALTARHGRTVGAAADRGLRRQPDRGRRLPGRPGARLPGRHARRTGRGLLARPAALRRRRHRLHLPGDRLLRARPAGTPPRAAAAGRCSPGSPAWCSWPASPWSRPAAAARPPTSLFTAAVHPGLDLDDLPSPSIATAASDADTPSPRAATGTAILCHQPEGERPCATSSCSRPSQLSPPPPALMEAIMKLGAEATAAGALLDNAGLAPERGRRPGPAQRRQSQRHRRPVRRGQGFISYAQYEVRSKEEAVEWASRFMTAAPGVRGPAGRASARC